MATLSQAGQIHFTIWLWATSSEIINQFKLKAAENITNWISTPQKSAMNEKDFKVQLIEAFYKSQSINLFVVC